MRVYATLLSTNNYLPGVLALYESLRSLGARYPLVVVISPTVSAETENQLRQAGILARKIPESAAIPKGILESNGHWGNTFDKIQLFSLVEFSKIVYVDSDMIVLSNIDELFDKPHMSGVAAGKIINPSWTRLNSGLLVIEPQANLAEKIFSALPKALADMSARGVTAIGDQDLLNAYYPGWSDAPELEVDQGYNVFQCHLDEVIEKHDYRLPDGKSGKAGSGPMVKIVHFVGPRKPWMKGAVIRHYWRVLKNGKSVRWENRVFSLYKKLLDCAQRNVVQRA